MSDSTRPRHDLGLEPGRRLVVSGKWDLRGLVRRCESCGGYGPAKVAQHAGPDVVPIGSKLVADLLPRFSAELKPDGQLVARARFFCPPCVAFAALPPDAPLN